MQKSTAKRRSNKLSKPTAHFPLTAHPTGRWCKKHKGKHYYFGKLENWEAALDRFNAEWPFIIAGRAPPAHGTDGCSLRMLCNSFLTTKRSRVEAGELSQLTFAGYHASCKAMVEYFGANRLVEDLVPADFEQFRNELSKRVGLVTLRNEINRCRIILRFADTERLINRSVHFGQAFSRPAARLLRESRNRSGERMFEANELRRILDTADSTLQAMVLLGINCGFGNTDVAKLPIRAVDLNGGWIIFPRPKTAVMRRIPLWPETINALRVALSNQPTARDETGAQLCFITIQGNPWVRVRQSRKDENKITVVDTVSAKFSALLGQLGLNGSNGRGFYTLRHVFETIGGGCRDQVAVNSIMGHADQSMAGIYRERIDDSRLIAVANHVHSWLFPKTTARKKKKPR